MNLEARKLSLIQEFLDIDNEQIINALEEFLHKNKFESFERNLKPMTLKQFNKEIDQALEDEANNRVTSIEELKQKIQEWS